MPKPISLINFKQECIYCASKRTIKRKLCVFLYIYCCDCDNLTSINIPAVINMIIVSILGDNNNPVLQVQIVDIFKNYSKNVSFKLGKHEAGNNFKGGILKKEDIKWLTDLLQESLNTE